MFCVDDEILMQSSDQIEIVGDEKIIVVIMGFRQTRIR